MQSNKLHPVLSLSGSVAFWVMQVPGDVLVPTLPTMQFNHCVTSPEAICQITFSFDTFVRFIFSATFVLKYFSEQNVIV